MNRFVRFLVLGVAVSLMAACINRPRQKETEYQPVSLFTPAYNALGRAIEEGAGEYNLDATIRIIRALDMAGMESGSFEEYISTLKESWPVFLKYREKWEKLCIKKDRAYLDVYDGRICWIDSPKYKESHEKNNDNPGAGRVLLPADVSTDHS